MKTEKFESLTFETMLGDNVYDTIEKMIALSKEMGKPVQTEFNEATFSVTPETTQEDAYSLWMKTMEENSEKWKNSPEGKKAAKKEKTRKEQEAKDNAEVDELVKDEVLDISAPKTWANSLEINSHPYGAGIARYAERWGKLMQVEMKKCKSEVLIKEIVEATKFKADNEGMCRWSRSCARNLLIQCWKHGAEFGKFEGFLDDQITEARRNAESME